MIALARRPSDRQLKRQIEHHLAETNRRGLARLAVSVADGRITLRGCVASFYERQLAIETCRPLAGPQQLTDAVEVAWTGEPDR
jgi:osmotically-inducible protein OsmY